jgi:hypothetical protein
MVISETGNIYSAPKETSSRSNRTFIQEFPNEEENKSEITD